MLGYYQPPEGAEIRKDISGSNFIQSGSSCGDRGERAEDLRADEGEGDMHPRQCL